MSPRPGKGRPRLWIWPAVVVGCGMLLHLPSLRWGFLWDDFLHQAVFRYGDAVPEVSRLNLYDYGVRPRPDEALGALGLYPWWTSEDFRVRFFRPVTSLSLLADYLAYGDWAPGYHLTSVILFGVLLALSYRLYRRLGASGAASLWALVFLALDDIHVVPVGWIANRNALLANLFVVATLLNVDWHCRTRSRWALAGAVACLFLALGAKETALTTVGVVTLYLWLLHGPRAEKETLLGACRRVLGSGVLWVVGLATALYAGGYVVTGHGTNSSFYSTPWHAWDAFVSRLATFAPLAGGSLFLGISTDFAFIRPSLAPTLAWAMAPLLGLLGWITWRQLRTQRLAGFAAGWLLIALGPAVGVAETDRLLMDATLASSLLLGLLIASLRANDDRPGPYRVWRHAVVGLLLFSGPGLGPPMTWIRGDLFLGMAATDREVVLRTDLRGERGSPRTVFVLNPPSSVLALNILPTWTILHADLGASFYLLQIARRPWEWRREGERALVISYGSPPLLAPIFERLFRTAPATPEVGTVFETAAFRATVLEIDRDGLRQVRFEFPRTPTDPSYHFLLWRDGAFRETSPPPIGETVRYEAAQPIQSFVP